jgi:hypothetical protein
MHEVGVERLIASVAFVGTYLGHGPGPLAVFPRLDVTSRKTSFLSARPARQAVRFR